MKDPIPALTRRDFLKLSGFGLLGIFSPDRPLQLFNDPFSALAGRVTSKTLWVYDQPSFKGVRVKMYWRDLILPITNVTINEDDPQAYNRIWYEVGTEGFVYSGNLQPVRTLLNAPTLAIPSTGPFFPQNSPQMTRTRVPSSSVISGIALAGMSW